MARKKTGEIILRLTYSIDVGPDNPVAEPEVLILADKAGWLDLANQFIEMSRQEVTKDNIAVGDPENHRHIHFDFDPSINRRLSHPIGMTLGLLTPETRGKVLKKYAIQTTPKSDRDLQHLFRRLAQSSARKIRCMERISRAFPKKS